MEDRSHNSAHGPTRDPSYQPADQASVTCRVCGAENRSNRLFCAECGTYLKSEEEDTWVDLPPVGGQPGFTTRPAAGPLETPPPAPPGAAASPLAWDDTFPTDQTRDRRSDDPTPPRLTGAAFTPVPPRRRRHWLLATFLVLLLLAAAGVTGAVAYRALVAPDGDPGDGGLSGGTVSSSTTSGSGSTTTTGGSDAGSTTSTGSTAPVDVGGELVPVISASASSTLPAEGENDYRALNVIDGRLSTCWSEDVDGKGVGEWIRLDLGESTTLVTIEIANGYQKDQRRFDGNPRVETLRVEYSDGSSQRVRLHDDMGFQIIAAPPSPTEWVKLVIESTYPGDTWQDTSISEVRLYRRTPR